MTLPRADRTFPTLPVGLIILVLAVIASLWLGQRERVAVEIVDRTLRVQHQITTVLSTMQDAETGQRGFLLTGRVSYLEPYTRAVTNLDRDLDKLEVLVADNPQQTAAVSRLRLATRQCLAALGQSLTAYRNVGPIAINPTQIADNKVLMNRVRAAVQTMEAAESRLLLDRAQSLRRQSTVITIVLILSAGIAITLGVVAVFDSRRRLAALVVARDTLMASNEALKTELETREAAEGQVRQMQKMEAVGQLTGGIAHDFNNMLAIVIGSLDVAKRRLTDAPDKAVRHIDNALEASERAAVLTSRLLAFSRQLPLAPQSLDANELVTGMSELLRRTIGDHLRVETVLAGGLWRCHADPGQLENAILNLCVNARDAMPDGGRLTLETSNAFLDDAYAGAHQEVTAGKYTLISVTDTGCGMPADIIEKAFDPFYTTKAVGKGTGLGLSQVHGYAKQSGGHVMIYSEPGVGTTVKIYLPRSLASAGATPAKTPRPLAVPQALAGEAILVVEDEDRVRALSVETLREIGYTVAHAADGAEAIALLQSDRRIDLLFTDIVMPGMNGQVLADTARDIRPGLKVLYTTGYTRSAIMHNGVLDPDAALLPKPFTFDQLARKVRQGLDAGVAGSPDDDAESPLPNFA